MSEEFVYKDPSISSNSEFDDSGDEDDELTLDEEEFLARADDTSIKDELDLLREESELSVEELRKRYFGDATTSAFMNEEDDTSPSRSASRSSLLAALTSTITTAIDDNDDDYVPTSNFSRKICVGSDYQVTNLPNLITSDDFGIDTNKEHNADPMWIPSFERCSLDVIENYLKDCNLKRSQRQEECGHHVPKPSTSSDMSYHPPDDENALYALYANNYDVEKAAKNVPFDWSAIKSINGARCTYTEPWREFTDDDCMLFEQGMISHRKNFLLIRNEQLPDRTVGELVRFYYTWKKSERHDMFVQANPRSDGKVDANSTDFMGQIMVQMLAGHGGESSDEENFEDIDEEGEEMLEGNELVGGEGLVEDEQLAENEELSEGEELAEDEQLAEDKELVVEGEDEETAQSGSPSADASEIDEA